MCVNNNIFEQRRLQDRLLQALAGEVNLCRALSQASRAAQLVIDETRLDFFPLVISPRTFFNKERELAQTPQIADVLDELQAIIETSKPVLEDYFIFDFKPGSERGPRNRQAPATSPFDWAN